MSTLPHLTREQLAEASRISARVESIEKARRHVGEWVAYAERIAGRGQAVKLSQPYDAVIEKYDAAGRRMQRNSYDAETTKLQISLPLSAVINAAKAEIAVFDRLLRQLGVEPTKLEAPR